MDTSTEVAPARKPLESQLSELLEALEHVCRVARIVESGSAMLVGAESQTKAVSGNEVATNEVATNVAAEILRIITVLHQYAAVINSIDRL